MTSVDAFIAAHRFGLGARKGSLQKIARDPKAWLLGQLGPRDGATPHLAGLPSSKDTLGEFIRVRRDPVKRKKFNKEKGNPVYLREATARTLAGIKTDTPFRERLVRFWSNHFTISIAVGKTRKIAGAYEREAIRPFVTGRFSDMLLAVAHHPAMLMYLDNTASVGPNSRAGQRRRRGLNENLAREILELQTLGVKGGYQQADVIALAKLLTGWSVAGNRQPDPGGFQFFPPRHEPGPKTLLGKIFNQGGEAEGIAALEMLATHPSTARFVATKLARHFISDDPPDSAIRRLERVFLDTGGDLGALARELVAMPECWEDPLAKIKTAEELTISTFRLIGVPEKPKQLLLPLRMLGQMPFSAPSPKGWPDKAAGWIGPELLLRRIELMDLLGKRFGKKIDARQIADEAFAPVARAETLTAIDRAASRAQALALSSSEFQRR